MIDKLVWVTAILILAFIGWLIIEGVVPKEEERVVGNLHYRGLVCVPWPCRDVWSQKWRK